MTGGESEERKREEERENVHRERRTHLLPNERLTFELLALPADRALASAQNRITQCGTILFGEGGARLSRFSSVVVMASAAHHVLKHHSRVTHSLTHYYLSVRVWCSPLG